MASANEPSWSKLLGLLDEQFADDPRGRNLVAAVRKEFEVNELERLETRETLAKYEEAYDKLTAPANRIGVFLEQLDQGLVRVAQGDGEYIANVDPNVEVEKLLPGVAVKLNDAYAVIGVLDGTPLGPILKVADALTDGRLRVGGEIQGGGGRLVRRVASLEGEKIKAGDEVRLDPSGRFAVEWFVQQEARDYFVEEVPPTPWENVGGQEEARQLIRESIENPVLYPEIYARFEKKPVKGILLYGPPGCGKTLLGKAIAYNMAREYSERKGQEVKEVFLQISGPKILNMWLGETERMVREIFAAAREQAKEGNLVVIFVDEAESILRTRSSGRMTNINNTVVPQFCAEMDGMVALENVVLVLTSNRPDYIDPAVLRPERIDRKIKVKRPDKDSSRQILSIYLHAGLPFDPELLEQEGGEPECARQALLELTLAYLWRETQETRFLEVVKRSGTTEVLHWKDMVSGALLKSIVDRAKDLAIKRAIAEPEATHGLRAEDMRAAVKDEYRENEIFPKTDATEDWLKLIDLDVENVVSARPIRETPQARALSRTVI